MIPPDWPNAAHSQFIRAAGLRWHVQVTGSGPPALLLHGTGASTHSWRGLAPILAQHMTVIAPDLPGHGFTEAPAAARLSLPGMARALQGLLQIMDIRPVTGIGHSAGAAILARMTIDGQIAPTRLVSLNGAFLPLQGIAGQIFSPLARVMAGLPGLPTLFARRAASPGMVARLLDATGSTLDAEGIALYQRLVTNPGHAASALGMMAHWNLAPLLTDLPRLQTALTLIVGANDRTVPPTQSARVAELVPGANLIPMPGLGHLAHEERPEETAALILRQG